MILDDFWKILGTTLLGIQPMFLLILFQKSPHVNQLSAIQVKGPCPDV